MNGDGKRTCGKIRARELHQQGSHTETCMSLCSENQAQGIRKISKDYKSNLKSTLSSSSYQSMSTSHLNELFQIYPTAKSTCTALVAVCFKTDKPLRPWIYYYNYFLQKHVCWFFLKNAPPNSLPSSHQSFTLPAEITLISTSFYKDRQEFRGKAVITQYLISGHAGLHLHLFLSAYSLCRWCE